MTVDVARGGWRHVGHIDEEFFVDGCEFANFGIVRLRERNVAGWRRRKGVGVRVAWLGRRPATTTSSTL